MTSIERELGHVQARIETVESELHALRVDMRELRDAMLGLHNSWRTLVVAVGLATSLGASLEHFLPLLTAPR